MNRHEIGRRSLLALLDVMENCSQEYLLGAWCHDCEYKFWATAVGDEEILRGPGGGGLNGGHWLGRGEANMLLALSRAVDGWYTWRGKGEVGVEEAGTAFIEMKDWLPRYQAWREKTLTEWRLTAERIAANSEKKGLRG